MSKEDVKFPEPTPAYTAIADDGGKSKSKKGKKSSTPKSDTPQAKKVVASARFSDPVTSARPVNVYLETVNGKDVVWYTTEDGKEVGRVPVTKRHDYEKRDIVVGFDYSIPATRDALQGIVKMAYVKTKYYLKDGNHRNEISTPDLLE